MSVTVDQSVTSGSIALRDAGPPPRYTWWIMRGDTLVLRFTLDAGAEMLTGATAELAVRTSPDALDVLLEASTASGEIAISPDTGLAVVTVEPAVTQALEFTQARGDLQVTYADGMIETVLDLDVHLQKDYAR